MIIPHQICTLCLKSKETIEFYTCKTAPSGFRYKCKDCDNKIRRLHYYANREKELARVKKYEQENKEKVNFDKREYYRKHKKRILARRIETKLRKQQEKNLTQE